MSGRAQAPLLRSNSSRKKTVKLHSPSPENHTLSVASRASTVKIKKEAPDDEIKEYAATTMSEFLSWYGYDKVDSGCTRGLNLDHFASSVPSIHHNSHILGSNFTSKAVVSRSPLSTNHSSSPHSRSSRSPPPPNPAVSLKDTTRSFKNTTSSPLSLRTAPASPRAQENSDSASDSPGSPITCSWCGRIDGSWEPGGGHVSCGIANGSEQFCSEACFAAGRRAAFKRARTCDWCRHVRHSISYVDFQDGESQLQFCSDKCLNQYKMNIFCRETQAHLALHDLGNAPSTNLATGSLITPDLWLRDCRSAPPSPAEEMLVVDDEPTFDEEKRPLRQDEEARQKNESRNSNKSSRGRNSANERVRLKNAVRNNKDCTSETDFEDESVKSTADSIPKEVLDERFSSLDSATKDRSFSRINLSSEIRNQQQSKKDLDDTGSSRESTRETPENGTYIKQQGHDLPIKEPTKGRRSARHNRPRRLLRSPTWVPENSTPILAPSASPSSRSIFPQTPPFKFPPQPTIFPGPTFPPRLPLQLPPQNFATSSFLPPVTVLVPYPIPIPIPLPIPIPIPLFGKFGEKRNDEGTPKSTEPEDLSKRGGNDRTTPLSKVVVEKEGPKQKNLTERHEEDETSTVRNSRPLRKRKRLTDGNEDGDSQMKKVRSKFVPV